jgi:uncharacterized membrane protein YqjE
MSIFEISFASLNLFSFMLGMIFAFFNQGFFGVRIGKYIIFYLLALAMFYATSYYVEKEMTKKYEEQTFVIPVPK